MIQFDADDYRNVSNNYLFCSFAFIIQGMRSSIFGLIGVLASCALIMACDGEDGVVVLDLCTPAGASDPFIHGRRLSISSRGDVSQTFLFDLNEGDNYSRQTSFPMDAQISLLVEVLNIGDMPIARGTTNNIVVQPNSRLCACVTLIDPQEAVHCEGLSCYYDTEDDRCSFYLRQ